MKSMNAQYVLDNLADQRNRALDALAQVQAELREAKERIAELEAKPERPDGPEAQS